MNTDPKEFSLAVVLFLGYGIAPYPDENPSRLIDVFGVDLASQLESKVRTFLGELKELKPDWSIHSLVSAGSWAREEIRRNHPELDAKALDAFEWVFTWWWK